MIACEVTDYQPGTSTRYLLIHGSVEHEDAKKIGCSTGSLFVAYEGHGAAVFTSGVHPDYVAEKFNIGHFMLDAWAIAQFIRARLGVELLDGADIEEKNYWTICPICKLPEYTRNYGCKCKGR